MCHAAVTVRHRVRHRSDCNAVETTQKAPPDLSRLGAMISQACPLSLAQSANGKRLCGAASEMELSFRCDSWCRTSRYGHSLCTCEGLSRLSGPPGPQSSQVRQVLPGPSGPTTGCSGQDRHHAGSLYPPGPPRSQSGTVIRASRLLCQRCEDELLQTHSGSVGK